MCLPFKIKNKNYASQTFVFPWSLSNYPYLKLVRRIPIWEMLTIVINLSFPAFDLEHEYHIWFWKLHLEFHSYKNFRNAQTLKSNTTIRNKTWSEFYPFVLGSEQQRLFGRGVLSNSPKTPRRSSRSVFSCCLSLLTSFVIHHWADYMCWWRNVHQWFLPDTHLRTASQA